MQSKPVGFIPVPAPNYMKKEEKKELFDRWKSLVNMSANELKTYYNSSDGLTSGISLQEGRRLGIRTGRQSARALMRMLPIGKTFTRAYNNWSSNDWEWAKHQVSFISRMKKLPGPLYRQDKSRSKRLKALLIWGHNPEKD